MNREFDLSARVSVQSKVLWGMLGVVQMANGLIHLSGGEHMILGVIMTAFGLFPVAGELLEQTNESFCGDAERRECRNRERLFESPSTSRFHPRDYVVPYVGRPYRFFLRGE